MFLGWLLPRQAGHQAEPCRGLLCGKELWGGRGTQASSVSLGQRKDFTALTPISSSLGRGSGRRRRSSGQLLLGVPAQPEGMS